MENSLSHPGPQHEHRTDGEDRLTFVSEAIWEHWGGFDDPTITKALAEALERANAEGTNEVEAYEAVLAEYEQGLDEVLDNLGESVVARLRSTAPKMLAGHRRRRKGFEYRLDWVWGEALDLLYQVLVCSQELGESFNVAHRPAAVDDQDHRFEALVLVHARACLVVSEIHALLRTGHAYDARARWRTLHETIRGGVSSGRR